jgi:hypothetical protein
MRFIMDCLYNKSIPDSPEIPGKAGGQVNNHPLAGQ